MQVEPFKVICVDDKNQPPQINAESRVVEGDEYTVDSVEFLLSSQAQGFTLVEKPLGEECFPYFYWTPTRFRLLTEAESLHMSESIADLIKKDDFQTA